MSVLKITDSVIKDLDSGKIIIGVENDSLIMSEAVHTNYPSLFMFYYYIDNDIYRLFAKDHKTVEEYVKFDHSLGVYVGNHQASNVKGDNHTFPYKWFNKNYSSKPSLDLFPKPSFVEKAISFPFTVGVEYESSAGFIPEYYCINKGLIPLRDGSIRGTEYATTVIKPEELIDAIDTHTSLMNEFCSIDPNCSTHIHLGNIPLNKADAFCIYACLLGIQDDLFTNYLSSRILKSGDFKATGKDYCKRLPSYADIDSLYSWMGMYNSKVLMLSFSEGHPASKDGRSKWNISTRYHWCNLVNYFFYPSAKTIEFRFLPPTASATLIKGMTFLMSEVIRLGMRISRKQKGKEYTLDALEPLLPTSVADVLKPLKKGKRVKFEAFLSEVSDLYGILDPKYNMPDILINPDYYRDKVFTDVSTAYYE